MDNRACMYDMLKLKKNSLYGKAVSMQRKKVRSISVSDIAFSKLNRVASRAGRNRSEVIERLLIAMSEDRLLWYARRKPDYDKKEVKTNEADANTESIAT